MFLLNVYFPPQPPSAPSRRLTEIITEGEKVKDGMKLFTERTKREKIN
jgi:hypothetical protein